MRINKYLALHTDQSRRSADTLIENGTVKVNGAVITAGYDVRPDDIVTLHGRPVVATATLQTIMLNKPVGYIVSREGQGGRTIYELLPSELRGLKPVGRLDKDSSGLLLLTNDGELANQLTHPRYSKQKIYHATLDKDLQPLHHQMITDHGIQLDDGPSQLGLERQREGDNKRWIVRMNEGRNRQIRRTFAALGYTVAALDRVAFGPYILPKTLPRGQWQTVS